MKIIKLFLLGSVFLEFLAVSSYAQIISKLVISKNGETPGNETSVCPVLSGDARFTTFESAASNLFSGDNNNRADLYLYDKQDGSIKLLSKNLNGVPQSGGDVIATCSSDLSRDGKVAVYATAGAGIVDSAQSNVSRIYAFNIPGGEPELLTTGALSEGAFFPSVSEDGKRVLFISSDPLLVSNGQSQVFLLERPSNTITMLTADKDGNPGNGVSSRASISHDGKWAAFNSKSTNLKGAEISSNNDAFQVFLLNIESGQHKILSVNNSGAVGNSDSLGVEVSEDGNETVFFTYATNLISADTNKSADVLLFNQSLNSLELVSLGNDGKRIKGSHELFDNALSADGNRVMFRSLIGAFDKFRIEVYVRDRKNSRTYLSSFDRACAFGEEGGESHSGSISPDANTLAFSIGKNTKSSPLQVLNVDLDVLQSISQAPNSLDTPDADVCRDTATLAMTPFNQGVFTTSLASSISTAKSQGVIYENRLKQGKNLIKQFNEKKNILTLKNLKPGNYSSSYRVKVTSSAGTTTSPFSPAVKFSIK